MLYLAGQISASLLAAALLGGFNGWTLRGDLTQPLAQKSTHSDQQR